MSNSQCLPSIILQQVSQHSPLYWHRSLLHQCLYLSTEISRYTRSYKVFDKAVSLLSCQLQLCDQTTQASQEILTLLKEVVTHMFATLSLYMVLILRNNFIDILHWVFCGACRHVHIPIYVYIAGVRMEGFISILHLWGCLIKRIGTMVQD